jgi:hypothetical protein
MDFFVMRGGSAELANKLLLAWAELALPVLDQG